MVGIYGSGISQVSFSCVLIPISIPLQDSSFGHQFSSFKRRLAQISRYSMLIKLLCRKIPTMLADHVEKNNLQGKLKYTLFVGASSGAETENRWAALNMIERRSPHQVGKSIAKGINNGDIKFFDKHLSMFPVDLVYVSATFFT
jgi:hypothetical protein